MPLGDVGYALDHSNLSEVESRMDLLNLRYQGAFNINPALDALHELGGDKYLNSSHYLSATANTI